MAKIRFKCTCGKILVVDDQHAGKVAKCPNCGQPVRVPTPGAAEDTRSQQEAKREISELTEEYEKLSAARERRERLEQALAEISKERRKRVAIVSASVCGALLLVWILYSIFRTYGPNVGRISSYPAEIRPIVRGLKRSDPLVRAAATWELADLTGDEYLLILEQMVEEDRPVPQLIAARTLLRVAPDRVASMADPLLEDSELDVRMTAAFVSALGKAGEVTPETLRPYMARALAGRSAWATWFESLGPDGPSAEDVREHLQARCESSDEDVRAEAAWMIAAALGPDPMILPLIRDPSPEVRRSAIHAAGLFLTDAAYDEIESDAELRERNKLLVNVGMRIAPESPLAVRRAAAIAVAHNGRDWSANLLARALADRDWFVRFAGAKGLEALTPALALQAARDAGVSDDDSEWVCRVIGRIKRKAAGVDS
ncbi:MAG: hypothetical protein R6V58_01470 [Planctomycetota bacterium]